MGRVHLRDTGTLQPRFGLDRGVDNEFGWNFFLGWLVLTYRVAPRLGPGPYRFFELKMGWSLRKQQLRWRKIRKLQRRIEDLYKKDSYYKRFKSLKVEYRLWLDGRDPWCSYDVD